jgi:hypothetical protein
MFPILGWFLWMWKWFIKIHHSVVALCSTMKCSPDWEEFWECENYILKFFIPILLLYSVLRLPSVRNACKIPWPRTLIYHHFPTLIISYFVEFIIYLSNISYFTPPIYHPYTPRFPKHQRNSLTQDIDLPPFPTTDYIRFRWVYNISF